MALGSGLLCLLCASAHAEPYELVDLATPYIAFWDETQALPPAERVAAFKSRFDGLLPGFFNARRVGWMTAEQYDTAIRDSFDRFPAIRARFTATTADFTKLLAPAHASFARTFPDVRPIGPIYLVHSLGEFDGGTRPVAGHTRLMFGADVIAQLHDFANERPFFHHELFHVYHAQFFAECEQMWCALWSEGLATLAAQRLNPGASDAELLLTSPRPLRAEVDANRRAAICAVSSRLESTDAADYAALFSSGPPLSGLPPRVGYYVGYLLAEEAARGRSLMQLAHQKNADARATLRAAMTRLARCPADSRSAEP
ncbi:MAG TPA: hypothetical protein VMF52_12715 [Steroidobacteraceae bacterium]|nr:hypothetical protein [Steroidobacteraceae bacterium]